MRTSHVQYVMMVEFMERNGDLSKPSGGPRGRHFIQMKWKELVEKLNSEGTGDSRSEEKWRKVWSDLKNNTKRKLAKINRAASGTGGGPALQLSLTDIENRVMQIIGVQAATGMAVVEAGFQQQVEERPISPVNPLICTEESNVGEVVLQNITEENWNFPGTSSQPTVVPPENRVQTPVPPPATAAIVDPEEHWTPPAPKKRKTENIAKLFVECDKNAREYARERDLAYDRLEMERLRLREYEIRERVRQRDLELSLKAQWLEFLKEAMNVIIKYFGRERERENKEIGIL